MSDQSPENAPRQGMDYGETEEVQETHAAIYREKVEPRIDTGVVLVLKENMDTPENQKLLQ